MRATAEGTEELIKPKRFRLSQLSRDTLMDYLFGGLPVLCHFTQYVLEEKVNELIANSAHFWLGRVISVAA